MLNAAAGNGNTSGSDCTVPVIDLGTFAEIKKIDVAINMHRIEPDNYGNYWNYETSNRRILYAIVDTRTREVVTRNVITDGIDDNIE